MESRRSKKTQSVGDVARSSRDVALAPAATTSTARAHAKERTLSAPIGLVPGSPAQGRLDGRQFKDKDSAVLQRRRQTTTETEALALIMPELTFAVLGAGGVGKSMFRRCALDIKKPLVSPSSSKKMSLEGDVFQITLLEVPLDDVEVSTDQCIIWPTAVDGLEVPRIDGVLTLFDVTDRGSIEAIPCFLDACAVNRVPCVLVSCKCDKPPNMRQMDPEKLAQSCLKKTGIETIQTSVGSAETYKRCISVLLQSLSVDHNIVSASANTGLRTRAMTATQPSPQRDSRTSHNTKFKHGRATSELTLRSTTSGYVSSGTDDITQRKDNHLRERSFSTISTSSEHAETSTLNESTKEEDGQDVSTYAASQTTNSLSSLDGNSGHEELEMQLSAMRTGFNKLQEQQSGNIGISFDDLVDRLLSQPMSKSDAKFVAIFLCLYRKFAAPAELLSAIVRRFEFLNDNGEEYLVRINSQLRYLAIIAQWVAEYPGDFAHPLTRKQTTSFITQIGSNMIFAVAAKEMSAHLEDVFEDDDTLWACSDKSRGRASTLGSFSNVPSMRSAMEAMMADEEPEQLTESGGVSRLDVEVARHSARHSKTPSTTSSAARSGSQSAISFSTLLNSLEVAQRQAELLTPTPRTQLTKIQWYQFMEISDEQIASELTRIDWILYSSIRPRDLIRHVSLSVEQKEKCRSLDHVNRMIGQFNHVALWVANMVLLRDKARDRARALEKFMGVAWKLRQFNNYNSLGAIIAGINGTAVHRLTQTRELVSQQAQKDFMRLEILMGTQKSHFAYRLAWENTSSERIPFLPLHRRDLVSAEEGNRTFVGESNDLINWRKFEFMGEVIVNVQRSQRTPYPDIERNLDIQRLVIDGKFSKDDDELYERSIQLEGSGAGDSTRRRFNWFQR